MDHAEQLPRNPQCMGPITHRTMAQYTELVFEPPRNSLKGRGDVPVNLELWFENLVAVN